MAKIPAVIVTEDNVATEQTIEWFPLDVSEQACKDRDRIWQEYKAKIATKH